MHVLQRIALALVIIGALNWGLIGFFDFDLIAAIFGGQGAGLSRIVYALVGISGLVSISLYFNEAAENGQVDGPDKVSSGSGNLKYGTEFAKDEHDYV